MGSGTWGAADENFLNRLRVAGVVPVVTVTDPALAPDLVGALVAGGLPFVEFTLRSAEGLDAIRAAQGRGAEIGAGTVTSVANATAAIDAGARTNIHLVPSLRRIDARATNGNIRKNGCPNHSAMPLTNR